MTNDIARKELNRLIGEASIIAPSIASVRDEKYGQVSDQNVNHQALFRWELECRALLQQLATPESTILSAIYMEFGQETNKKSGYHSKSIYVHKVQQLLVTALQLIESSPLLEIPRPGGSRKETATTQLQANVSKEPDYPSKITLAWLQRNVPIGWWIGAAGVLVTVFLAGIQASRISLVQDLFLLTHGSQTLSPRSVNPKEQQSAPVPPNKPANAQNFEPTIPPKNDK